MGFLDSLFGGGGSSGTQTVRTEIPKWASTGLHRGFQIADIASKQPIAGLPSKYAPLTSATRQGLNMMMGPAWNSLSDTLSGDWMRWGRNAPGMGALNETARGNYLMGGPGFNAAVDAATKYAMPRIQSQFGLSGRYGGGLEKEAIASAIGDAFARQYGMERQNQLGAAGQLADAYSQERQRQMQGLALAPSVFAAPGAITDADEQRRIADYAERRFFNAPQNLHFRKAQNYANTVAPLMGGMPSSTSQPLYQNTLGQMLGGASMGAGLGSALGLGGPWGALIGAGLGILG